MRLRIPNNLITRALALMWWWGVLVVCVLVAKIVDRYRDWKETR